MKFLVCFLGIHLSSHHSRANAFNVLYTDSTGLKWGERGPQNLANGCEDLDGNFSEENCTFERDENGDPIVFETYYEVGLETSEAAKFCRSVGARLPRASESVKLIEDFEHYNSIVRPFPILTDKGRFDLIEALPDMKNTDNYLYPFWTSSITKDSFWGAPISSFSYILSPSEGSLNSIGRAKSHGIGTRCVQD